MVPPPPKKESKIEKIRQFIPAGGEWDGLEIEAQHDESPT